MNERIKELAGKANIHFSRIGILDGDPNGSARVVGYSKIEKFAELIVRDCVKLCYETTGNSYLNGVAAGTKIMLHFGIEK